jgi:ABC-type phosphate/phosphonate transport system substrate-binding protein
MRQLSVLLILLSCFGAAGASELTPQDRTVVAQVDDRSKAPLASPGDAGRTVALLLAVPEITSLSELAGKNIAIDEAASASSDEARRKVEATVNAKLAEGGARALDRLVNGEVSAAVLTLAYPETAEWSAEIAGFKVFRIPLVDRPVMAGLAPADPAVSDTQSARIPLSLPSSEARAGVVDRGTASNTGKVREQMRVATVIAEHVMTLRDAEKKALPSPSHGEPSVAIIVAGPEIKSVSDLTGKIIAIDDRYLNSHARIQAAIVSAGAIGSLLASGESPALDRLLSGKTSAAVLTLVYPETGFSMIEGYSVFRVPLAAVQPSR